MAWRSCLWHVFTGSQECYSLTTRSKSTFPNLGLSEKGLVIGFTDYRFYRQNLVNVILMIHDS